MNNRRWWNRQAKVNESQSPHDECKQEFTQRHQSKHLSRTCCRGKQTHTSWKGFIISASGFVYSGSISAVGNSCGTDQKKAAFDWKGFTSTIPKGEALLISRETESWQWDEISHSASFSSEPEIMVDESVPTFTSQTHFAENERPSRSCCNLLTIQPGANATKCCDRYWDATGISWSCSTVI